MMLVINHRIHGIPEFEWDVNEFLEMSRPLSLPYERWKLEDWEDLFDEGSDEYESMDELPS